MSGELVVHLAGPGMSIQDLGRPGYRGQGITCGGAADPVAIHEGAALLAQSAKLAAIEMTGVGGRFEATADVAIALTGAEMTAQIDGAPLLWNASHTLPSGAMLTIGGVRSGAYGYLSVAGGLDTEPVLGARGAHLTAGIGDWLQSGMRLPLGEPKGRPRAGYVLRPEPRLSGGAVRIVSSMQSEMFSEDSRQRFCATTFTRDARANRQGVRMNHDGRGFEAEGGLSIVSEVIVPGDIQITGDGAPFVLMCECQTTGGYPRIGTVIPADLPIVAQAPVGAPIRFVMITFEEAVAIESKARAALERLPSLVQPMLRDPHDIQDLLSYQLVGGAVSAAADPFSE